MSTALNFGTHLKRILSLEPTLSMYASFEVTYEYLAKPWRQYTSDHHVGVDGLVERFLGVHAQQPKTDNDEKDGFPQQYMYAHTPAAVLMFEGKGFVCRGAVYVNGGVWLTERDHDERTLALMVDHDTATKWGYPSSYFTPTT